MFRSSKYYIKLNNSEKDKHHVLSLTCGTQTKQNRNRPTHIENKLRVAKEKGKCQLSSQMTSGHRKHLDLAQERVLPTSKTASSRRLGRAGPLK